jgi:hypothetical protein
VVDYHRLGLGLFDRIQTRYLEKRKAALRQKREAARQRASDDGLSSRRPREGRRRTGALHRRAAPD